MQTLLVEPRRARDQVRALLETMIGDGSLRGGDRLDEVGLSQRIGVSRTPLREALIALEGEGLVHSLPNRGFRVVEANESLVREVFPILAALEAAALRLAGAKLSTAASELRSINAALARSRVKAKQYELDMAFHQRLTRDCGNERLLKLLERHRTQSRRFDGAHARGTADHTGSCRKHAAIVALIEKGRIDDAATLLQTHWRQGEEVVIKWLRRQP